jgi:hypothetical protein
MPIERRNGAATMMTFTKESLSTTSQITILNLNEALSLSRRSHVDPNKSNQSPNTSETSTASLSNTHSTLGRSVSFSESIQNTEPTLHHSHFTIPERRATWYDTLETRCLKAKRTRLIKLLEQGEPVIECTRGLEPRTKEGKRRRALNIMNAVSTVLNEQEQQDDRYSADPEALAHAYSMFTRQSQMEAVERAAEDQKEASLSTLSVC